MSKYLLLSLPTSISPTDAHDEALTALRASVGNDAGTLVPFSIPEFKVGTLEALIQQADELAKLDGGCLSVVQKVGDSLNNILDGDEDKIVRQKMVNDKPVDQYLRGFSWNKVKYRADRSIADLVDSLHKEITSIDNDLRGKYNQYNGVKTNLVNLQKKQNGNLSNKSLTSVVPKNLIIQDSEYLETHLVAVPAQLARDFPKLYETISPWVVPRSMVKVTSDDEFTLFAVTTFKKYSTEFVHKCREQKWTPRDYQYKEGGGAEEKNELDKVEKEERRLWGDTLRLARTSYGDAVMAWVHVLALRVFVETVLRYGLPLSFVCGLLKTNEKLAKKTRQKLDKEYAYLAGNAIGRDKKGNPSKDDSSTSADMQAAGHVGDGNEYSPYVCYDFEIP